MAVRPQICLVNPNSSSIVTARMATALGCCLGPEYQVTATTMAAAPPIILDPAGVAHADALITAAFRAGQDPLDGVVIGSFSDPAVTRLRRQLAVPVIGLAEAAMRAAAAVGDFIILSPAPKLNAGIIAQARQLGLHGSLKAVLTAPISATDLLGSVDDMAAVLGHEIDKALAAQPAAAVILGAGPLVDAAAILAAKKPPYTVISPLAAAAQMICDKIDP